MHPEIAQTIATERAQELQAHAAQAGQARGLRRTRRGPTRLPDGGRAWALLPAARPLRSPKAA